MVSPFKNPFKRRDPKHGAAAASSPAVEKPKNQGGKPRHPVRFADEQAANPSSSASLRDYELKEELGRGGFAVVRRAHKRGEQLGVDVAVRIVPLQRVQQELQSTSLAELEARLAWAKSIPERYKDQFEMTPHVLYLLEYKITQTDLITFSEVCYGGDMFDRIISSPGGHFTEDDAREATRNLCRALELVHRVGCIHRDIKPVRRSGLAAFNVAHRKAQENVFYRQKDSHPKDVVLADFGCAIIGTNASEHHTGVVGSPGYIAPEIIAGQPYTMIVDEWSLGILIYEMLSGRSPMVSNTPEELKRETLQRDIPYPRQYWSSFSEEARDFTQRLLTKDPKKRMKVEEAVEHPWLKHPVANATPAVSTTVLDANESTADGSAPLINRKTTNALTAGRPTWSRIGLDSAPASGMTGDTVSFVTGAVLAGKVKSLHTSRLQQIESDEVSDTSRGSTAPIKDGQLCGLQDPIGVRRRDNDWLLATYSRRSVRDIWQRFCNDSK